MKQGYVGIKSAVHNQEQFPVGSFKSRVCFFMLLWVELADKLYNPKLTPPIVEMGGRLWFVDS